MKRVLLIFSIVLALCLFIAGQTTAAELGLKLGSSTITFKDSTGQTTDVDFDYVAALYLDFVDVNQYTKTGLGPSFEIAYASKSLGDELCIDQNNNLTYCDEDFTYTGFEVNLKAVYGSDFRIFAYGGISTNRLAIDITPQTTGQSYSFVEEYYWGFQGAAGAQYVFMNNFAIGGEYKYKVYSDNELDHQQFITINFGYQF